MLLIDSGTLVADGTEQDISPQAPATPKFYSLDLSCLAMQNGDIVELRAYKKMLSAGNAWECVYYDRFPDQQSVNDIIKASIAIKVNIAGKFTVKQIAGTLRSYKWELYSF